MEAGSPRRIAWRMCEHVGFSVAFNTTSRAAALASPDCLVGLIRRAGFVLAHVLALNKL